MLAFINVIQLYQRIHRLIYYMYIERLPSQLMSKNPQAVYSRSRAQDICVVDIKWRLKLKYKMGYETRNKDVIGDVAKDNFASQFVELKLMNGLNQ